MNRSVENQAIERAAPYRLRPEYRDQAGSQAGNVTPLSRQRSLLGLRPRRPILFLGGRVSITFGHHRHFFVGDDAA